MAADYGPAAWALYRHFGTWRAVAVAVDGPSEEPRGSYYRRIAKGDIKRPGAAVRKGIAKLYAKHCQGDVTAGYKPLERTRRFPMVVEMLLGLAINEWRENHRMTWNQWAAKADALMRREYGGSEE